MRDCQSTSLSTKERTYADFLAGKVARAPQRGLSRTPALSEHLFPFQRHCVEFLLNARSMSGCSISSSGATARSLAAGCRTIS